MQPAFLPLKQQVIQKAREILSKEPIFLDTETTGLGTSDEIIEIALVDHKGNILFQSLIHPTIPIPAESSRINNITNEMVQSAPYWHQVWPDVGALLQGKIAVIYNSEFDVRMMTQTHQAWRMPWKKTFMPVCLMKLYAAFLGDWNSYKNDFRFVTLEKAGQQCGIQIPNSHRATDDTLLAHALLKYLASLEIAS
jgi:DNA polymerase III epsilon subunit-like protein